MTKKKKKKNLDFHFPYAILHLFHSSLHSFSIPSSFRSSLVQTRDIRPSATISLCLIWRTPTLRTMTPKTLRTVRLRLKRPQMIAL